MTDERDIRDPALDAMLRTHSAQTPSASIDAAILAAAHRAVETAPGARSARAVQPWRWWMPLAAAAVIGIVVIGIVPVAPTLVEPASTRSEAPTNAVAAPPPASPRADTKRASSSPNADRLKGAPESSSHSNASQGAGEQAPAMTAKTIAAPPAAPQRDVARALADRNAPPPLPSNASDAAAERSMPPPPAAADARASSSASRPDAGLTDQRARQAARSLSPDQWIAHIRALRNEARMTEAAIALAEFRGAFGDADTRLPEDLRAWAKTVR